MKRMISAVCLMLVVVAQGDDLPDGVMTQEVDGVVWYFSHPETGNSYSTIAITNEVRVGYCPYSSYSTIEPVQAVSPNMTGAITIPTELGGLPVTQISKYAFKNCREITAITIPSTIKSLNSSLFSGCDKLRSVIFTGDAPELVEYNSYYSSASSNPFAGSSLRLVVYVPKGSIGWDGSVTTRLPESWSGRAIAHVGETYDWDSGSSVVEKVMTINITNTVIHYIVNSVRPDLVVPETSETGFVNIITEVKSGGAVAVPEAWAANYPSFVTTFGSNFTKALTKTTGKRDGAGNQMLVWQDYVAGTDPTDENDAFRASVSIVEGKPVVSWTPELSATETSLRKYTVYGKAKLGDAEWSVVDGNESDYNFFKVTVEMR